MKLDQLQVFLALIELGTMTAVAKHQQSSVMAVSKKIAQLEKLVGQPLFTRSRRAFALTEFGTQFSERANEIVAQFESLNSWVEEKNGRVSGCLRVVSQSPEMFRDTVTPWLAEFLKIYPEITVELDVQPSVLDLNNDSYDIFWGVSDYLGESFPNLRRRTLWTSDYGLFASPAYLRAYGTPKTIDELDLHQVVGYLHNQPSDVLLLQLESGEAVYKTLPSSVKTVTGLIELASAGLGIVNAATDDGAVKEALLKGELAPVLADFWYKDAKSYVYYHKVQGEQAKVRAFIDFFVGQRARWL